MSLRALCTVVSALSFPLLAASCGSSTTPDQACTDVAKAQCALLDKCRMNGTADTYGSLGNCITRIHDNCVSALMAMGTGNSPDVTEACAMAYPSETCQNYEQGNPVAACAPKAGSGSIGTACAYDAQCASAYCGVPVGSLCGTCVAQPAIGDPCVMYGCAANQVCTANQTCQAWVQAGGACDNKNLECAPNNQCVIAAGATAGTCQAAVMTAGAACDYKKQTGPGCDAIQGLYCASSNKCIAIMYVAAGANCGTAGAGASDAVCTGGAGCYASMTPMMPDMCIALADYGDACDTSLGPACMSPGRCVTSGGTSGMCAAPDPTMCM